MIAGRTLDSLNLPPIDICKMDIEGAEFMALQGMEQTLGRSPHIKLMVEYVRVLGASEELLTYLRRNFSSVQVIEPALPGEIPAFVICWRYAKEAEPLHFQFLPLTSGAGRTSANTFSHMAKTFSRLKRCRTSGARDASFSLASPSLMR